VKALHCVVLVAVIGVVGFSQAQTAKSQNGSDATRLIGAWRLVHIESPGPDGKTSSEPQPTGMLIYTRDGHMSVQLMYPSQANAQSNQYVRDGYEASFGSYEVDEAKHILTHHVQASVTRDQLVGKDLPRVYAFTPDGRLTIRSTNPDERWFVVWEHY
jgi:hypothetical protein